MISECLLDSFQREGSDSTLGYASAAAGTSLTVIISKGMK
jgi:hypothetical protein